MHTPETATLMDVTAVRRLLELIRALTSELSGHNHAIGEFDVAEVEKRLMTERKICGEMDRLLQLRQMKVSEEDSHLPREEVRTAVRELSTVLRTHAALTWRSRRSMHALANVLCTSGGLPSGTYSGGRSFSASNGA